MKQYNKANIPLAKQLRKNMTPWERKLWYEFLRTYPVRFQRQKAIGNYIVDFYCAKAKLVIELDGGGHYNAINKQADEARTANLEGMNLKLLRICNLDVDQNFMGVCEYIDNEVRQSLPQSASLTAPSSEGAVVWCRNQQKIFALGFFDGVHLGHQALLRECVRLSCQLNMAAAAITFDAHPQSLFLSEPPKLLTTLPQREALLRQYGMDAVYAYPVTKEVMSTNWQDFLLQLMDMGAAGFVCGRDFRFGHKGEGNGENLQRFCREHALPCVIVEDQLLDGIRVSSSHIRGLLEQGDIREAERFLGHSYAITGKVVEGRGLGRTIGVPTANLQPDPAVQVPRHGVYASSVCIDGTVYAAVTNIGSRPTVQGHHVTVEPWILDFSGDLYGQQLELRLHAFLRPERKFASLEELKAEIQENALQTRALLSFPAE